MVPWPFIPICLIVGVLVGITAVALCMAASNYSREDEGRDDDE